MSHYLLSVHHGVDEAMPAMEDMQPVFEAVEAFNDNLRTSAKWVFAGGLQGIEATSTVDATGAEPIVADGPYAESKEYLGGFWIIEAADLDEALAWATEGSRACRARVEVRPFQSE